MFKWLSSILNSNAAVTNYIFMEQALSKVLNDNAKFDVIRARYFLADSSLDNVFETLTENRVD